MTISAKIIADSVSPSGVRITTMELEFPRWILAEFNTHRMFSRNFQSSRAVPTERMIDLIKGNPAKPIVWGSNKPGMSAGEELEDVSFVKETWHTACANAIMYSNRLQEAGLHKQWSSRVLEPFMHVKGVVTATEWDNFFELRLHPDAQPEIQELARVMKEAMDASKPRQLRAGDWHVPYFGQGYWTPEGGDGTINDPSTLEYALAISSSCCAQISYRRLDDSLEKAKNIFQRLIESKPAHASPFEHQATPMLMEIDETGCFTCKGWEVGITHVDRYGDYWSANFKNWIQHRQLLNL